MRLTFLGLNHTNQGIKILAQGHIALPSVRLEPGTSGSQVAHSTTEQPHSSYQWFNNTQTVSNNSILSMGVNTYIT